MQNIGAANFARVGHAFEVRQCAVRFRLREAHFDASGAAGMRFQFTRRAESDYLAEVHDGDAVAESFGLFNVMRRHQDGFFLAAQFLDNVVDFPAHLRIKSRGWFVQEDNFRIVDQSHGESEALLLAAGKLAIKSVALFFQAEALEQFFRLAAAFVEAGEKTKSFHDTELVGERRGLQRNADFVLEGVRIALRVQAADGNAAAVGIAEAFEDFNGSGFAGAVRPEQAENFSFFHIETDAANGFDVAVALDEILHLKNAISHVRCPAPPRARSEKRL